MPERGNTFCVGGLEGRLGGEKRVWESKHRGRDEERVSRMGSVRPMGARRAAGPITPWRQKDLTSDGGAERRNEV